MIGLSSVTKNQGGRTLYSNASFQAQPGDRIGLVGPNGAGKTTIFRLLSGEEAADNGQVIRPNSITLGYFSQDVGEMHGRSVLEETMAGVEDLALLKSRIADMEQRLAEPMDDDAMAALLEAYGDAQALFESRGGYDLDVRAQEILSGLGFSLDDFHRSVENFSGGWKMRIALARILLLKPDALLMDEPTNHLDLESIMWLEQWLMEFKGILVMTSHDRTFMNRVVNKIVEIAHGNITTYSGNYDFYERERDIRKEQLLASFRRQQEMLAKEEEFIAKFAARASHAAQVQSRVKKLDKIDRIEVPPEEKAVKFQFNKPPRSGDDVVKMNTVGKEWASADGRKKRVFSGVTGLVRRLDKVALVGVNGAGKSTLLKIIAGQTEATEGACNLGASLEVGYFSQHALEVLSPNRTILEQLQSVAPQASIGTLKTLLGAFLFSDDEVNKKISVLSGGEKSRVVLACILIRPVNFIILDEPTNHLDIRSREILMDALREFEGTVIIVSHDRHFLSQITNRVFRIDHGEMQIYEGGFKEYLNSSMHDGKAH
ncbi:MAG: ABC-F family ATP-binding cassette domain-containing protein [Betaproteobacteria bacterium]|nr:ABC-F family ATP-binding cassette domain-containing protein [Betaproteobacteria bacterium]